MAQWQGFPDIRCHRAALAVNNSNSEDAFNWLMAHMDDPDLDLPLDNIGGAAASPVSLALNCSQDVNCLF